MKRRSGRAPFFISVLFLVVFGFLTTVGWTQESRLDFELSHSVDWARREVLLRASFDLARAGIRLPTGRFLGEEILREAYPGLLRPFLLSLKVDSSSTVRDMVDRGEVTLGELDAVCREAGQVPASLSADLTRMSGRYTVFMEKIGAILTRHRSAVSPERPLVPVPAADYTGIIIIADRELPVHGRRSRALAEPCLFPKIWDTHMNLVYERNMFDPALKADRPMARYTVPESIFRPTPSGLDAETEALVGPNPLRVLAREVFGITPTDPVIDRDDALKILSSENNRRLLREGRVLLVLDGGRLSFASAQ